MEDLTSLKDEELYENWHRGGNADALLVLLERWAIRLPYFYYKKGVRREDAEDFTQDVLTKIMTVGSFNGRGKFASWVYQIAKNQWLARLS